jgi:hypothetical protein
MSLYAKQYTKKIKTFMRKAGVSDLFSQSYEEVSDQMTMDEFACQCWILLQTEQYKKTLKEACRGLPTEFMWIYKKHNWGKFHTALHLALNHNYKIDTIRENIKMTSLKDYSQSIQPVRRECTRDLLSSV